MDEEQLEKLGRIVDQASNLIAASKLPLPAHIHVIGMLGGLKEIHTELKAIYIAVTGENPWLGGPDE